MACETATDRFEIYWGRLTARSATVSGSSQPNCCSSTASVASDASLPAACRTLMRRRNSSGRRLAGQDVERASLCLRQLGEGLALRLAQEGRVHDHRPAVVQQHARPRAQRGIGLFVRLRAVEAFVQA